MPVLLLVCHVFQLQNFKLEAIKDDEASTCHKTAQHEKLNVLFRCPHHQQKGETLLQLGVALQVRIAFTL